MKFSFSFLLLVFTCLLISHAIAKSRGSSSRSSYSYSSYRSSYSGPYYSSRYGSTYYDGYDPDNDCNLPENKEKCAIAGIIIGSIIGAGFLIAFICFGVIKIRKYLDDRKYRHTPTVYF